MVIDQRFNDFEKIEKSSELRLQKTGKLREPKRCKSIRIFGRMFGTYIFFFKV